MRTPQSSERGIEEIKSEVTQRVLEAWREQKSVTKVVSEITDLYHQQLQKARADWLRSEIEKLEGMIDHYCITGSPCEFENRAIDSIITRYKEELKVLESK